MMSSKIMFRIQFSNEFSEILQYFVNPPKYLCKIGPILVYKKCMEKFFVVVTLTPNKKV